MVIGHVAVAEPYLELRPNRQQRGHGEVEPLGLDPNGRETEARSPHDRTVLPSNRGVISRRDELSYPKVNP